MRDGSHLGFTKTCASGKLRSSYKKEQEGIKDKKKEKRERKRSFMKKAMKKKERVLRRKRREITKTHLFVL